MLENLESRQRNLNLHRSVLVRDAHLCEDENQQGSEGMHLHVELGLSLQLPLHLYAGGTDP